MELDYYGFVVGAEITEEVATDLGLIKCRLRRFVRHGRAGIEVDLWQSMVFMGASFTSFAAGVTMRPEGGRYVIESKYYRNANALWVQLEQRISNLIIVNE